MVLTFLIIIFVLMLQFLWLYIDDLIGKGLSLGVIAEFIFWGMMSFVPLALPLSTMLASIMTMGGLGENNELLAMRAAGIPLQRTMRPLMIWVFFISIGAFFISNNLIPYANLKIKTLMSDIKSKREEIKIPAGIFYNGIEDLSLYVTKQDDKTGLMYDIMLYDHRDKKGNTSVTLADSGYIRLTENKQHIVFLFYDGYTYEEGERKDSRDTTYPFQRRHFTRQEVLVPLEGYDFQRSDGENYRNDAPMQSIGRLSSMNDSLSAVLTAGQEKFLQTVLNPSYLPNYYLRDSLMWQKKIYTAPFDSLFNDLSLEKRLETARQSIGNIERNVIYATNFAAEQERSDYPRRGAEIEWHRKLTMSIACFIFFFIGAPLGAIIRKGGLGMPTVVSIFFFLFYWVIDITGKRLATDGAWDPVFATGLSSLVLLPIVIFLTYKATTDSALFSVDRYFGYFYKGLRWLPALLYTKRSIITLPDNYQADKQKLVRIIEELTTKCEWYLSNIIRNHLAESFVEEERYKLNQIGDQYDLLRAFLNKNNIDYPELSIRYYEVGFIGELFISLLSNRYAVRSIRKHYLGKELEQIIEANNNLLRILNRVK